MCRSVPCPWRVVEGLLHSLAYHTFRLIVFFVRRDLKDTLSQRSKVLFVDEPRMLRAAFVHFASEEDREQAVAAFQNTQLLGGTVDVVPVRHARSQPRTYILFHCTSIPECKGACCPAVLAMAPS